MRLPSLAAKGLAVWAVVASAGCTSPTLPLPPPLAPSISAGPDADHVMLTAECNPPEADSVIVIINDTPGVPLDRAVGGALTSACGAWDAVVYAHSGDILNITYEIDGLTSLPTTISPP
jgi:hypothetical protein